MTGRLQTDTSGSLGDVDQSDPRPVRFVESRPLSDVAAPSANELPFSVRIVRTEEHLSKAIEIRAAAYGRHFPEIGERFRDPEEADRAPFSLVLLAESKETGEALGTLRIETNFKGPLSVETLMPEASQYAGKTIAFVTRLGVKQCPEANFIKLTLFKALHRYCLACQIEWIVVIARPPMDRQYLKLSFMDVYRGGELIPIAWADNVPMRLLVLEAVSLERKWRSIRHPLYKFFFTDYTPDITIFSSVTGVWGRPRMQVEPLPEPAALEQVFGISVV